MIATKDSIEPHSSAQLPASTRVYVQGELFPEVRVPMREIELSPTRTLSGALEETRRCGFTTARGRGAIRNSKESRRMDCRRRVRRGSRRGKMWKPTMAAK